MFFVIWLAVVEICGGVTLRDLFRLIIFFSFFYLTLAERGCLSVKDRSRNAGYVGIVYTVLSGELLSPSKPFPAIILVD